MPPYSQYTASHTVWGANNKHVSIWICARSNDASRRNPTISWNDSLSSSVDPINSSYACLEPQESAGTNTSEPLKTQWIQRGLRLVVFPAERRTKSGRAVAHYRAGLTAASQPVFSRRLAGVSTWVASGSDLIRTSFTRGTALMRWLQLLWTNLIPFHPWESAINWTVSIFSQGHSPLQFPGLLLSNCQRCWTDDSAVSPFFSWHRAKIYLL